MIAPFATSEPPPSASFPRARLVVTGDPVTSRDMASLARAINARLTSGLGDGPFRIVFWVLNLFRRLRNPDATGLVWPSEAEFFEAYQMLDPAGHGDPLYPDADPGDPEGINLDNPIAAHVYGNATVGFDDEATRLNQVPLAMPGDVAPASATDYWELAKSQRGGGDPETGAVASPVMAAARSFAGIRYSRHAWYGNSYGSWLSAPEVQTYPACEDPDASDEYPAPLNYVVRFTSLVEGVDDKEYPGTCMPGPDITPGTYDSHVAGIAYAPWAYYVYLWGGTVEVLPTTEWLEGPYRGDPRLTKQAGGQMERAFHTFAGEFAGVDQSADSEKLLHEPDGTGPASGGWCGSACDFQALFTRPWLLAPARGTQDGEDVDVTYPAYAWTAPASAPFTVTGSPTAGSELTGHAACRVIGFWVKATGLKAGTSATVNLLRGATLVGSVTVSDTSVDEVQMLANPQVGGTYNVTLDGTAEFEDSSGRIDCELAEVLDYHPEAWDIHVLLRRGAARDGGESGLDGRGLDETEAAEIGTDYLRWGCILNRHGLAAAPSTPSTIGQNSVFDAARRMSRCVRLLPPASLVDYAVEDGNSILWFKRTHSVTGQDWFRGLADEVTATAPEQGFTNRWVLGGWTKPYDTSESSIYKPDVYGARWAIADRCHFFSSELANDPDLLWHTAYGWRSTSPLGVFFAEAPTGWRYAWLSTPYSGSTHANSKVCAEDDGPCEADRRDFFRSCRLYEPDPEVVGVEAVTESGEDRVKVTLNGRLHHSTMAPSAITRGPSGWSGPVIASEPYRTLESAIRLYLVHQAGSYNPPATTGDHALKSPIVDQPEKPYASIWPHLYLVRLIPEPHADGNDVTDAGTDTPLYHGPLSTAELYLRAMCEGFVDGETSVLPENCAVGARRLFDFTYEQLCLSAFGGRRIHPLPKATSAKTAVEQTRPEQASGCGPLPRTRVTAEVFNQYVRAVNLLTRVRVMLPCVLEKKTTRHTGIQSVSFEDVDDCGALGGANNWYGAWNGTPPVATTYSEIGSDLDWAEVADSVQASSFAALSFSVEAGWNVTTQREVVQFRYRLVTPEAELAIPPAWRQLLTTNLDGLLYQQTITNAPCLTSESEDCEQQCPDFDFTCALGSVQTDVSECVLTSNGTVDPGAAPAGWIAAGYIASIGGEPQTCDLGWGRSIFVTALTTQPDMFLTVPLVDDEPAS